MELSIMMLCKLSTKDLHFSQDNIKKYLALFVKKLPE